MKRLTKVILGITVIAVSISALVAQAPAAEQESYDIRVVVPTESRFKVSIYQVNAENDLWATEESNAVNFGTLEWDEDNNIFLPDVYYAVEVGVVHNSGGNWVVQHQTSPVNFGGETLDDNINVTFVKQIDDNTGEEIEKVVYAETNSYNVTKNDLTGGWLRIYYGIATGNTDPNEGAVDAEDAEVIGAEKPAGTYTGSVTLSLTP